MATLTIRTRITRDVPRRSLIERLAHRLYVTRMNAAMRQIERRRFARADFR